MDISEFIEVAKNLNVLGIKITKDGELAAEWPVSLNAGEISTLRRKALHPVQLVLLFRKV